MFFFVNCKKDGTDKACMDYPVPADTYQYPILPGSQEWAVLQTGEERLQACQIPANIVTQISTDGLIQSWLDMPLNNEIFMTNSIQNAMSIFIEKFSGLAELVTRNDAPGKLFERYSQMDPACVINYRSSIEKGNFTFLFSYLELLLAQDNILGNMALQKKRILLKEALRKYDTKLAYSTYFGSITNDLCLFICAKVMLNEEFQPFLNQLNGNLWWFIHNALFPAPLGDYSSERNIIISNATNFAE